MIAEIGHFALVLALCVALVQAVVPLVGAKRGLDSWMAVAGPASALQFLFIAMAFGALTHAYVTSDFSLVNVASNSHTEKPMLYKVAGVWGNHEGSLLLWITILAVFGFAVTLFGRNLPPGLKSRALAVQAMISVGFLAFILLTSNPFARLDPPPIDGNGLNPMLQDPGLAFHPPFLYLGYVGFSMAFSFAIAALLEGRVDAAWARWVRPWTLAAWIFLTCGIVLGSWWAYYTLGWGGWWYWDPVENASFMPWLIGTALLHSLAVTEKRGAFKNWTVLLAIIAFSLSLLGTFLVRSGVLTSVHAFASDPRRGIFILILLAIVVGVSFFLYAWRAPQSTPGGSFNVVSRESLILVGNVFLVVASASVLLGTIYPLILDSLNAGKISVGPPYFNSVFVPIMIPVVFLLGLGPWANWKNANPGDLARRVWGIAAVAVVFAVGVPLLRGELTWLVGIGMWLAFWIFGSGLVQIVRRLKSGMPPRSFWGMQLGHFGIGVFIVGVTMVGGYQEEKDVRMERGDVVTVGGFQFKLEGVARVEGPNYEAIRGTVVVSKDGVVKTTLYPEKRNYGEGSMPMTEAAIDSGVARDVYVSLGEALEGNAWAVRAYYKPFVDWIWIGCLFMALGGLVAMSDKRYRLKRKQAVAARAGVARA